MLGIKNMDLMRQQIEKRILYDTCRIYPNDLDTTVSALGIRERVAPTAKTYNGSTEIPCRFDSVTSYRPDKLHVQVVDADEYMVVLPYDVRDLIEIGDNIYHNELLYTIRQMTQGLGQFDGVVELRVHKLGLTADQLSAYRVDPTPDYYPQAVADLGYNVWDWDASKLDTLFQDSLKTTPVTANSDPVGAWVDGVSGVDAIQATTANKPTYSTGTLNGLPTLSFDGSDLLATANISISTFAVWVVFRSSITGAHLIYEHSVLSASNDGMYLNTSTGQTINVRRTTRNNKELSLNWGNDNTWRVVRHAHNGTNASHTLTINNVLQMLADNETNNVGTGTATQPLFIGARSGLVLPMTGNIAHLCIVSPYPTADIITSMESYINSLWSVY